MTKKELIEKVESKQGFAGIISDELARDNVAGDTIQKRRLYINHRNLDGTMGKTSIYYVFDEASDTASFYNTEPLTFDMKENTPEQAVLEEMKTYLKTAFYAYFIINDRVDTKNNWVVAEVYTKYASNELVKATVLVSKKDSLLSHANIV